MHNISELSVARAVLVAAAACFGTAGWHVQMATHSTSAFTIVAAASLLSAAILPHIHGVIWQAHEWLRILYLCAGALAVHRRHTTGTPKNAIEAEELFATHTSIEVTLLRAIFLGSCGLSMGYYPLRDHRLDKSTVLLFVGELLCMAALHLRDSPDGASRMALVALVASVVVPLPAAYALPSRLRAGLGYRAARIGPLSPPTSPPMPECSEPSTASTQPPTPAGSAPSMMLFTSTVAAFRATSWPAACAILEPAIEADAGVDADGTDRYKARCKELYTLIRVQYAIGVDRTFAKLKASIEGMEGAVPRQLRVALHGFMEDRLKYGVVQHLVETALSDPQLQEADVPALLDRYRWRLDRQRAHFERCVSQVVRGLASVRAEVEQLEANHLASLVEVEAQLAHAKQRFDKGIARAFDKHWAGCVDASGLPTPAMRDAIRRKVVDLAESAMRECRTREEQRIDPFLGGGDGNEGPLPTIEALLAEMALEELCQDGVRVAWPPNDDDAMGKAASARGLPSNPSMLRMSPRCCD